jgi:hypothetical protein
MPKLKRALCWLWLYSLLTIVAPVAMAQQKQHVSYDTPAAITKYTQQHIIDIGDVPGHQARLFEIQRTYGNDAPIINGMKLKEQWTRGMSDYIDNNGPAYIYNVFVLENGDKFFVRTSLVAQSSGDGKLINITSGVVTGGTGSLARMHGIVSSNGPSQPMAGINANQTEIDYWME